ncbi:MAG TPA: SGNH/GDSL hydrolase family protein [Kiritimatiellia bacterium]|nr:SGNH/GDSL hydrolase family protein [Kiritimatiellia bacterium]HRZ13253.1 SGNH/GDSL hydrolase family protein [Kiritimatiellia bacterium]HSA18702.1 SGNH/GDSL hydrolase family protein [Kiritimatiellia bacterium]
MDRPSCGPGRALLKRLLLAVVMTALVLAALEGALRLAGFRHEPRQKVLWKPTVAGFIGTEEFYIQTDFAPPGYIWVSQPNTPYTDRYGFRRPEVPVEKQPGQFRVAFLGGSTTQGGYRPYPERVIRLLNAATGGTRYEMLNVGCSSYSTHQSLIALERWVWPRHPDLVIVYHGWNDQIVQADGFSDHEKDALLSLAPGSRPSWAVRVQNMRLAQGVGRLLQAVDRSWPRPRVPVDRFRSNLDEFAERCRKRGTRLMIFVRPESRRYPLPAYEAGALEHFSRAYKTTNTLELYKAIHADYSAAQREPREGAEVFDAWAVVNRLYERQQAGEFGPGVEIWQNDSIHLRPLGEELLAQELAPAIAPEAAEAVKTFVQSGRYWSFLAGEFLNERLPHEAVYCARRAKEADPALTAAMDELTRRAEKDFEFVALFEEGRWGGTDPAFESKLRKLSKCLGMRPADHGVLVQIFRTCLYSNRPEMAADALAGYRPASAPHRYEWLNMRLQSLLAGNRLQEAEGVAVEMLNMNPREAQVRGVLDQIRARRTP